MINFDKEREAFEAWQDSIGSNIAKRGIEYVNDRTASEWFSWRKRAALAQTEINELKQKLAEEQAKQTMWRDENNHAIKRWSDIAKDCEALKQKLEKLESGEFVLVPRNANDDMWKSGWREFEISESMHKAYKAMIEAVERDHE